MLLQQTSELRHLAGIALQIERQAMRGKPGKAVLPGSIAGHVARGIGAICIAVPVDDMADAADVGVRNMGCEQIVDIALGQIGIGDDRIGHAVRVGGGLQPFGFGQRVAWIGTGIDMDHAAHIPATCFHQIVGKRVVLGDGRDRAVGPPVIERRGQPGIAQA